MATFYKQNDAGEYIEADNDVDELFRQKSDEIVRSKLGKAREREAEKIREEIEAEVRENAENSIRTEIKDGLEAEYKPKIEALEAKNKELDVALRRKVIAAEYGFKSETEQFLGDGSDEDMRAKADVLKSSFETKSFNGIEKQSEPTVSKLQNETGIKVEIK